MLSPFALVLLTVLPAQIIELPVEPPSRRVIEYEEVWRTHPDSDEYLLERVSKMVVDDEGNLYAFEDQREELLKFDAEGNFNGTLTGPGKGPGEIGYIHHLSYWPPNTILLTRGASARIVRVTTDGAPLDDIRVQRDGGDVKQSDVRRIVPAGEYAVFKGSDWQLAGEDATSRKWLGVIDRDGQVLHEFSQDETAYPRDREWFEFDKEYEFDELGVFGEWSRLAASPDGHVFRAPAREEWKLERYDLEGNLQFTIHRDIEPRKRTEEELASLEELVVQGYRRGVEVTCKLAETQPPIHGLRVVSDKLWVEVFVSEEERSEGLWLRASVLSLDGELIEEIDARLDYDRDTDLARLMADGSVVVVENGRDAWKANLAEREGESLPEEFDPEPISIVMYRPRD